MRLSSNSAVVSACKKSIDDNYTTLIKKDLADLFSRSGFTDGYYENTLGRDMFGYREKENVQSATKELLSKYASTPGSGAYSSSYIASHTAGIFPPFLSISSYLVKAGFQPTTLPKTRKFVNSSTGIGA